MPRLPDRQSPCRIDQAKGNRRHPCSYWHAALVEDYRRERHAQDLRAEEVAVGYDTETRAYFGQDGAGDAVEARITWKSWLLDHPSEKPPDDEEEVA